MATTSCAVMALYIVTSHIQCGVTQYSNTLTTPYCIWQCTYSNSDYRVLFICTYLYVFVCICMYCIIYVFICICMYLYAFVCIYMYSSYGWASTLKNEGRNVKEVEGCNSELSLLWKETRERSLGLTVHGVQCTYLCTYVHTYVLLIPHTYRMPACVDPQFTWLHMWLQCNTPTNTSQTPTPLLVFIQTCPKW